MTSAPNQASIWVHAGPAWTPVKSITLIPASGLSVMVLSCSVRVGVGWRWSLLRRRDVADGDALGVEVCDVAALGTRTGVDGAVDEGRAARGQRLGERGGDLGGSGRAVALAAERLDHQ